MIEEKIPRVIHYCWFGPSQMSAEQLHNIQTWEVQNPEFKLKLWNEENFDIASFPYCQKAYKQGKYAFVSDFARLWILYNFGGVYLDTDVEVIKPLRTFLENECFFGLDENAEINSGLIVGSRRDNSEIGDLLQIYDALGRKEFSETTCVSITTDYFLTKGFVREDRLQMIGDSRIYPREFFCPRSFGNTKLHLTENTHTIHHYDASWLVDNARDRKILMRNVRVGRLIEKLFGKGSLKMLRRVFRSLRK